MLSLRGKLNKFFLYVGIFLLAFFIVVPFGTVKAQQAIPGTFQKPVNGTLSADDWNYLLGYSDVTSLVYSGGLPSGAFVNTKLPALMAGPLGINTVPEGARLRIMAGATDTKLMSLLNNSGTEIFTVLNPSGNVGIGTTNPQTKLDVNGILRTNSVVTFSALNTPGLVMTDASGNLYSSSTSAIITPIITSSSGWTANGATVYKTDTSGNVGIGTTNPLGKLNIKPDLISADLNAQEIGTISITNNSAGTASPTITGKTNNSQAGLQFISATANTNTNAGMTFNIREDDNTDFATLTTAGFSFNRYTTNLLTILRNGNVGIGTSNPVAKLEIKKINDGAQAWTPNLLLNYGYTGIGANGLRIRTDSADISYDIFGYDHSAVDDEFLGFKVYAGGGETDSFPVSSPQLAIHKSGNVGIGTTNPTQRLDINGDLRVGGGNIYGGIGGGVAGIWRYSTTYPNYGIFYSDLAVDRIDFSPNGGGTSTPVMSIAGNANTGIGNTNPTYKLDVNGSLRAANATLSGFVNAAGLVMSDATGLLYTQQNPVGTSLLPSAVSGQTLRYNGSAWVSNSTLYNNGTNVGIGTTNPTAKLSVVAPAASDALVRIIAANYATEYDARLFIGETDSAGMTIEYDGLANIGYLGMNKTVDPTGAWSKRIQMSRDGTEVAFMAGNVGIGTANPRQKLDLAIVGPSGENEVSSIMLGVNNGPSTNDGTGFGGGLIWKTAYGGTYTKRSAGILQTAEGNYFKSGLAFFTNNVSDSTTDWTEKMRIAMSGNVGIGNTNPSYKLDTNGSFRAANATLSGFVNAAGLVMSDATGLLYTQQNPVGTSLLPSAVSGQTLRYNGSAWVSNSTLYNNGTNVGIGTTNPGASLQIGDYFAINKGDSNYMGAIGFNRNPFGGSIFNSSFSAHQIHNYQGKLNFQTYNSGGTLLSTSVIDATGNVGIGTINPYAKLHVYNNVDGVFNGLVIDNRKTYGVGTGINETSRLVLSLSEGGDPLTRVFGYMEAGTNSETSSSDGWLALGTRTAGSATEKVRITSNGNVGIGNTNPSYKLDTNGSFRAANATLSGFVNAAGLVMSDATGLLYTQQNPVGNTLLPSGTSGHTLRYDGSAWVSNSNIFNNGTNVGVGTTAPSTKMEISGTFKVSASSSVLTLDADGNVYIGI